MIKFINKYKKHSNIENHYLYIEDENIIHISVRRCMKRIFYI